MCPALWDRPRSRSSSWPVITTRFWSRAVKGVLAVSLAAMALPFGLRDIYRAPVALSPIPIRWTVHLEKPTACRRTMYCRTSCDAHDQRKRIIWRQAIRLSRRPGKCMCVGLRPSSRSRRDLGSVLRRLSIRCATRLPGPTVTNGIFMRMTGQLLHRERGLADSAGQIF